MKHASLVLIAMVLIALLTASPASAEFGLGGGVYYNRMLGDIKDWDIDKNYISYLLSLKYQFMDFLSVEGMLDYYPGNGAIDYTLRPSATAVLGNLINAGVGVNWSYVNFKSGGDDKWSEISYHFKLGVQVPIGSILWVNVDAFYFVDELKEIEDFNKDFITFGARVHYRF